MAWLADADVIVAGVSTPLLDVGYELGRAESLKKPTLCLYRERDGRSLSHMVSGNAETMVGLYQIEEEVLTHIRTFLRDFAANPR